MWTGCHELTTAFKKLSLAASGFSGEETCSETDVSRINHVMNHKRLLHMFQRTGKIPTVCSSHNGRVLEIKSKRRAGHSCAFGS